MRSSRLCGCRTVADLQFQRGLRAQNLRHVGHHLLAKSRQCHLACGSREEPFTQLGLELRNAVRQSGLRHEALGGCVGE